MNISGESFDYGPWRWAPTWDAGFTAAYFDHAGLYAFGRQPEALHWNCGQLAVALRLLSDAPPLVAALERFPELYRTNLARRFLWRLGLAPRGLEADLAVVVAAEKAMRESGGSIDEFFFRHRGGRAAEGDLTEALAGYAGENGDSYWSEGAPQSMLIDEVEAIWAAIAERDDWALLHAKLDAVKRMGNALGEPPTPAGHTG
jgi:uncharacterized protein YdiU (UPF0061 family)